MCVLILQAPSLLCTAICIQCNGILSLYLSAEKYFLGGQTQGTNESLLIFHNMEFNRKEKQLPRGDGKMDVTLDNSRLHCLCVNVC